MPFAARYHPARPYLLQRGLYALLAFDIWVCMLSHGARYGMGDFNVTHFAWLDAFVPVPSAAVYVGTLTFTGLCALTLALVGMARWLQAAVCVLYTASWMVSLHDSYQHHYLLSWLLLWTLFMPDVSARAASEPRVEPVCGVGLPMTALTSAIVYAFTAVSKSEVDWREGHVLMRLSRSKPAGHPEAGLLDPVRDGLVSLFGIEEATAWTLLAHSVIALQIVIAFGYLAAAMRDAAPSRVRATLCALGLVGAVSFHGLAELSGIFQIGWFSYYMLWVAFTLMSPAPFVAHVARAVGAPGRFVDRLLARPPAGLTVGLALGAIALGMGLVGLLVDLPGVAAACCLMATVQLGWGALLLRASFVGSAQWLCAAGALSTLALAASTMLTEVRFDYYRRAGGELLQMQRSREALAAYQKAERYAPAGKSRRDKLERLEQQVAREGVQP
jgi:hypothetical protein